MGLPQLRFAVSGKPGWVRYRVIGLAVVAFASVLLGAAATKARIRFVSASIGFRLESDETTIRHVPATMAGGVAVFDFNKDGRPDIFFANGANIETLRKDSQSIKIASFETMVVAFSPM